MPMLDQNSAPSIVMQRHDRLAGHFRSAGPVEGYVSGPKVKVMEIGTPHSISEKASLSIQATVKAT
jgi:hypothetical protein